MTEQSKKRMLEIFKKYDLKDIDKAFTFVMRMGLIPKDANPTDLDTLVNYLEAILIRKYYG